MTRTDETRPTLSQNAMGFVIFFAGLGAMIWMKLDNTITWPGIILSFIVSGAGAWIVAAPRLAGYVETVGHVADVVQQVRGGQMNVNPPVDTSTVVNRPEGATVVVPPQAAPVVLDDAPPRAARLSAPDRHALNTAETVRITTLPDAAIPDPTVSRRRRRKTDVAPPLPEPQEHPAYTPPPVQTPTGDDEGLL